MKILILGMGKTGTTALYFKIFNSLPKESRKGFFEPRKEYTEEADDSSVYVVAKVLFYDSDAVSPVRLESFKPFDRKILIVRDPRDTIVSLLLWNTYSLAKEHGIGFVKELIKALKAKEKRPDSVSIIDLHNEMHEIDPGYFQRFEKLTNLFLAYHRDNQDCFVYRYEDMCDGVFGRLEEYLGFSLCEKLEIALVHSHVIRTKSYGDWRNWFTTDDIAYFRPKLKEMMGKYGYDDEWQLNEKQIILAKHSSDYVKKITEFQQRAEKKREVESRMKYVTDKIRSLKQRSFRLIKKQLYAISTLRYEALEWLSCCFARGRDKVVLHQPPKLVSIVIPTLAMGSQADHLITLKNLLSKYLPRQTYPHYEAIVYCDGPNEEVNKMVASLGDKRIKLHSLEKNLALWGHPQTREGIKKAKGEYFVRMNDDNRPFSHYLETLVSGFDENTGAVYGKVVFKGRDALKMHGCVFLNSLKRGIPNDLKAFILPTDYKHSIVYSNVDCMNFMVRMDIAKDHVDDWSDVFHADWVFIEKLQKAGTSFKFVDRLIGGKY